MYMQITNKIKTIEFPKIKSEDKKIEYFRTKTRFIIFLLVRKKNCELNKYLLKTLH